MQARKAALSSRHIKRVLRKGLKRRRDERGRVTNPARDRRAAVRQIVDKLGKSICHAAREIIYQSQIGPGLKRVIDRPAASFVYANWAARGIRFALKRVAIDRAYQSYAARPRVRHLDDQPSAEVAARVKMPGRGEGRANA